ncbi:MAG TPA: glycosyltransferase family 4 protein [Acidimicrobiales bacterium]|nr:glycosyltransferase family 4 protein [Acidimicrobiales bacterium]
MAGDGAVRLGYVAAWQHNDRAATWSGTTLHLQEALARQPGLRLVDVDATPPRALVAGLRRATWRREDGRWEHPTRYTRAATALFEATARRAARRAEANGDVSAYLTIGDLAALDRPYWVYQDMSYDWLRRLRRQVPPGMVMGAGFAGVTQAMVERLWARQKAVFERAAGVLTMAEWIRQDMIERSGLDPDRVHTVYGGATALPTRAVDPAEQHSPGERLLFIGRHLEAKGADDLVAAFRILRKRRPELRLTVAGPTAWTLPDPPPLGVTFEGPVGLDRVRRLYATHDLFVMPSRFEGFGIVFVEALAHGLPCIGRDLMAMPELISPGVNGALLSAGGGAEELASLIDDCLDDDQLHRSCRKGAEEVSRQFSWNAVAARIAEVIAAGDLR